MRNELLDARCCVHTRECKIDTFKADQHWHIATHPRQHRWRCACTARRTTNRHKYNYVHVFGARLGESMCHTEVVPCWYAALPVWVAVLHPTRVAVGAQTPPPVTPPMPCAWHTARVLPRGTWLCNFILPFRQRLPPREDGGRESCNGGSVGVAGQRGEVILLVEVGEPRASFIALVEEIEVVQFNAPTVGNVAQQLVPGRYDFQKVHIAQLETRNRCVLFENHITILC